MDPCDWAEGVLALCDENENRKTQLQQQVDVMVQERNSIITDQNRIKRAILEIKNRVA